MNKKIFLILMLVFVSFYNIVKSEQTDPIIRRGLYANSPIPKIEFNSADLQSVFRLLSEYSGVDIISGVNRDIKVTIYLRNKTWQQVLDIICKINKLTPVVADGYIYVLTTDDYNNLMLNNAKSTQEFENVAPLKMKIIRILNSKAAEINNAITSLLSTRGRTTVVEKTNSIIIVDTEKNIKQIEEVIKRLDLETPQVLIEARLVYVDHDVVEELGVNWKFIEANQNFGVSSLPGTPADRVVSVEAPANSGTNNFVLRNGGFSFGVLDYVTLDYLARTNKADILASPQIVTLDNKEAEVFMGERVPILTRDAEGHTSTQLIDAGTKLVVKPHITRDGKILMELQPSKKSYQVDPQLGQPIFKEQSAKTEVLVEDGQTIVIGGLTNKEELEVKRGIPILRDIPLIGILFRYTRKEKINRDLVIFVTPHIIQSHKKEDLQAEDLGSLQEENNNNNPTSQISEPKDKGN